MNIFDNEKLNDRQKIEMLFNCLKKSEEHDETIQKYSDLCALVDNPATHKENADEYLRRYFNRRHLGMEL